jgi:hypothetical protein
VTRARSCRHCKSPARGNPCWYFLDHPEQVEPGADPPCIDDSYSEEYEDRMDGRRKRRRRAWSIFFVLVILASAGAYLLFR